jgi:hypothetical protein
MATNVKSDCDVKLQLSGALEFTVLVCNAEGGSRMVRISLNDRGELGDSLNEAHAMSSFG